MAFQGAIFDVDGVLVDSPHELAWRESFRMLMETEWHDIRDQTSWGWNATAAAPWPVSMSGSPSGCWPWPQRSGGTGSSAHPTSDPWSPTTIELSSTDSEAIIQ